MLPGGRRASRIDYILLRDVGAPVATEVLFTGPAAFGLVSDHMGLLVEVGDL
jgi:endonuclease/exonuclease/phosphatase family metal-dependent hydrolase